MPVIAGKGTVRFLSLSTPDSFLCSELWEADVQFPSPVSKRSLRQETGSAGSGENSYSSLLGCRSDSGCNFFFDYRSYQEGPSQWSSRSQGADGFLL